MYVDSDRQVTLQTIHVLSPHPLHGDCFTDFDYCRSSGHERASVSSSRFRDEAFDRCRGTCLAMSTTR